MKTLVLIGGQLEVQEIESNLESLQAIVGGYIEVPLLCNMFKNNNIDVIINEEGKYIDGLKPSITLISGKTKQILDIIYGNCIFASHDEHGETIGLNEEQMKIVMRELNMEVILQYPNEEIEHKTRALFIE